MALRAAAQTVPPQTRPPRLAARKMVTIRWQFRNGHEWERTFYTETEGRNYWHTIATHPDIVRVWINDKLMRES